MDQVTDFGCFPKDARNALLLPAGKLSRGEINPICQPPCASEGRATPRTGGGRLPNQFELYRGQGGLSGI